MIHAAREYIANLEVITRLIEVIFHKDLIEELSLATKVVDGIDPDAPPLYQDYTPENRVIALEWEKTSAHIDISMLLSP